MGRIAERLQREMDPKSHRDTYPAPNSDASRFDPQTSYEDSSRLHFPDPSLDTDNGDGIDIQVSPTPRSRHRGEPPVLPDEESSSFASPYHSYHETTATRRPFRLHRTHAQQLRPRATQADPYLPPQPEGPAFGEEERKTPPPAPMKTSDEYGDEMWQDEQVVEIATMAADDLDNAPDDEPVASVQVLQERQAIADSYVPNNEHGIPLVPLTALPDRYRQLFKFPAFNAVQSKVFEVAYKSDENLVVSAPTGSGKTTIFELAFVRLMQYGQTYGAEPALAVYMAPTKALCNERAKDWQERMGGTGFICVEVTGDTTATANVAKALRGAHLVVTTPEKWDSLTRRTGSTVSMLDRLALIMIDEVHILREHRGATLEVVVSRMKARGSHVRFVALSASVPNIDDVARWLGPPARIPEPTGVYEGGGTGGLISEIQRPSTVKEMPMAKAFKFGEEFRPTKLHRETYGFDGGNDWALASRLDKELYPLLLRHSEGQPVLVFCPTRRTCQATAEHIAKLYKDAQDTHQRLPWSHPPNTSLSLKDSKLAELSHCGIAVHHAGLEYTDRREIEEGFKRGDLHMIVSTSTLAVGVNLPAHTVIIKGTMTWQGPAAGFQEYSDIDIQQMMGRAGRPQFDTSGTVIVMCERAKVAKYRDMLNSQTILESCLHDNLTEHLNSEIALKTIVSLKSAQEWLKNSFLFRRIQQNPSHYAFAASRDKPSNKSWEEWLDHYVEQALEKLKQHNLVTHPATDSFEDDRLRIGLEPTPCGLIMSSCCISYGTMCTIMEIQSTADLRNVITVLSAATEFADLRIRPGESQMLNKLRVSAELRYSLDEPVKTYADKVFLYLQVCFGTISMENYQAKTENASPNQTLMAIFNHAPRIAKAIAQVSLERCLGQASRSALELVHTVNGKAWEDSPSIFRQLDNIGPKSIRVLEANGVTTFDEFIKLDPTRLQTWLNRIYPFGSKIIDQAQELPKYRVDMHEEHVDLDSGPFPRVTIKVTVVALSKPKKEDKQKKKSGFKRYYNLSLLFLRSDDTFIDFRRLPLARLNKNTNSTTIDVELGDPNHRVIAHAGVDEVSGCATVTVYDPAIPPSSFPLKMPDPEDEAPEAAKEKLSTITSTAITSGKDHCSHSCKDKSACAHVCCKKSNHAPGSAHNVYDLTDVDGGEALFLDDFSKGIEPASDDEVPAMTSGRNAKRTVSNLKRKQGGDVSIMNNMDHNSGDRSETFSHPVSLNDRGVPPVQPLYDSSRGVDTQVSKRARFANSDSTGVSSTQPGTQLRSKVADTPKQLVPQPPADMSDWLDDDDLTRFRKKPQKPILKQFSATVTASFPAVDAEALFERTSPIASMSPHVALFIPKQSDLPHGLTVLDNSGYSAVSNTTAPAQLVDADDDISSDDEVIRSIMRMQSKA